MYLRSGRSKFRSILPLLIFFLTFAIFTCSGPTACRASDARGQNIIFILDASGSMASQFQGKVKIEVAKEALAGLIRDLPSGINTGLVVFGHRQKSDCNDVEELSPLGPLEKGALTGKIKTINPKGMTPITLSVQKVAESLKSVEGESTIILVSDGEETCKGDPCAMVRSLKESGIKFTMHVIGFDVSEKEKAQLACIAEAGGGFLFRGEKRRRAESCREKGRRKNGAGGRQIEAARIKERQANTGLLCNHQGGRERGKGSGKGRPKAGSPSRGNDLQTDAGCI